MEKQKHYHRKRKQPQELLRSGRSVDKIWMASDTSGKMGDIYALAMEAGVVVTNCDRRKLDQMSETGVHQGVIAQAAAREYVSVEDILQAAADKGEQPFILLCDGITDPHNLGAMIRSQAAIRGSDSGLRQGFCRCGRIYASGQGEQPGSDHRQAEGSRGLGVRCGR